MAHVRERSAPPDTDKEGERKRSIKVGVRFRPLNASEDARKGSQGNSGDMWKLDTDKGEIKNVQMAERWRFDHVFTEEYVTDQVFEVMAKDIVQACVDGYNGTIFAYGQTSSGKTFTMHGDQQRTGIIPSSVHELFRLMNTEPNNARQFTMSCSYMEIYNETVLDLLANPVQEVKLFDKPDGTLEVKNLSLEEVTSGPEDILNTIKKGEHNRHIASTRVNERSSRSHTILRIKLESKGQDENGLSVRRAELNLVDLAGSEGLKNTAATGARRIEGSNINKSLLSLSNVIKQLSDPKLAAKGGSHISYRESKLTRLLQFAVGGNSQTALILAVSPAQQNYAETKSSLEFAQRAKKVQTKVTKNIFQSKDEIAQMQAKELKELRTQFAALTKEHALSCKSGNLVPADGKKAMAELAALEEKTQEIEAKERQVKADRKNLESARAQLNGEQANLAKRDVKLQDGENKFAPRQTAVENREYAVEERENALQQEQEAFEQKQIDGDIDVVKEKLAAREKDVSSLKENLTTKSDEIEELTSEKEGLTEKLTNTESELKKLTDELAGLEDAAIQARAEDSARATVAAAVEARAVFDEERLQIQDERNVLRQKLNEKEAASERHAAFDDEKAKFEEMKAVWESERKTKEEEFEVLAKKTSNLDEITRQIDAQNARLEELKAACTNQEKSDIAGSANSEKLASERKQLEDDRAAFEKEKAEVPDSDYSEKLAAAQKEFEAERADFEKMKANADTSKESEKLASERQELEHQRAELEKEKANPAVSDESEKLAAERKQFEEQRAGFENCRLKAQAAVSDDSEKLAAERKQIDEQRVEFEKEKEEWKANVDAQNTPSVAVDQVQIEVTEDKSTDQTENTKEAEALAKQAEELATERSQVEKLKREADDETAKAAEAKREVEAEREKVLNLQKEFEKQQEDARIKAQEESKQKEKTRPSTGGRKRARSSCKSAVADEDESRVESANKRAAVSEEAAVQLEREVASLTEERTRFSTEAEQLKRELSQKSVELKAVGEELSETEKTNHATAAEKSEFATEKADFLKEKMTWSQERADMKLVIEKASEEAKRSQQVAAEKDSAQEKVASIQQTADESAAALKRAVDEEKTAKEAALKKAEELEWSVGEVTAKKVAAEKAAEQLKNTTDEAVFAKVALEKMNVELQRSIERALAEKKEAEKTAKSLKRSTADAEKAKEEAETAAAEAKRLADEAVAKKVEAEKLVTQTKSNAEKIADDKVKELQKVADAARADVQARQAEAKARQESIVSSKNELLLEGQRLAEERTRIEQTEASLEAQHVHVESMLRDLDAEKSEAAKAMALGKEGQKQLDEVRKIEAETARLRQQLDEEKKSQETLFQERADSLKEQQEKLDAERSQFESERGSRGAGEVGLVSETDASPRSNRRLSATPSTRKRRRTVTFADGPPEETLFEVPEKTPNAFGSSLFAPKCEITKKEVEHMDELIQCADADETTRPPKRPRLAMEGEPVCDRNPLTNVDLKFDPDSLDGARKLYSAVDDHLELALQMDEEKNEVCEENNQLREKVTKLEKGLYDSQKESARLRGELKSTDTHLPNDAKMEALEEGLREEAQKRKALELELDTMLVERRHHALEKSRVTMVQTELAAAKKRIGSLEMENDKLRIAPSTVKKAVTGEDIAKMLNTNKENIQNSSRKQMPEHQTPVSKTPGGKQKDESCNQQ